jgi:sec-independent protein translocase protein TatA
MSFPGGVEWFVILVVALLLFGKRLPEVARSMGRSITEFKKGLSGIEGEVHKEVMKDAALPPRTSDKESAEKKN